MYTSYYSAYYSDYYGDFYADYYTAAAIQEVGNVPTKSLDSEKTHSVRLTATIILSYM